MTDKLHWLLPDPPMRFNQETGKHEGKTHDDIQVTVEPSVYRECVSDDTHNFLVENQIPLREEDRDQDEDFDLRDYLDREVHVPGFWIDLASLGQPGIKITYPVGHPDALDPVLATK